MHVQVSWELYQENRKSINEYIKALGIVIVKYLSGKKKRKGKKRGRGLKINLLRNLAHFSLSLYTERAQNYFLLSVKIWAISSASSQIPFTPYANEISKESMKITNLQYISYS